MKIPLKSIQHCVIGKAPFMATIITIGSKKQKKIEVKEIMKEVINKPSFQTLEPYFQNLEPSVKTSFQILEPYMSRGLILEGDWENYPLQLYEILEFVRKYNLELVIGVESSLANLENNLGISCAGKIYNTLDSTQKDSIPQNEKDVYHFIGAVILDYFVPYTYYIKVGLKNGKKVSREQFGIALDNNKQYIIKMETRKDGNDEN